MTAYYACIIQIMSHGDLDNEIHDIFTVDKVAADESVKMATFATIALTVILALTGVRGAEITPPRPELSESFSAKVSSPYRCMYS